MKSSVDEILEELRARFAPTGSGDAAAERLETSAEQVERFREQIKKKNYEVDDAYSTGKTRGSAQRAFAEAVKRNYRFRCAITGIGTSEFLVASHIVPWSEDKSIRLDPSNGICLSLLMDRAFEKGYIIIEDNCTIRVDWTRVGGDNVLGEQLKIYDGKRLKTPRNEAANPEYLARRRKFVLTGSILAPPECRHGLGWSNGQVSDLRLSGICSTVKPVSSHLPVLQGHRKEELNYHRLNSVTQSERHWRAPARSEAIRGRQHRGRYVSFVSRWRMPPPGAALP